MVAAVALQNQTEPKRQQFYKLTLERLKQDYKAKILNAEAYLYYLIRAKRAAGWEWCVNVKRFCAKWEIAESTFYWALSRLRAKNGISSRSNGNTIVLWWNEEVGEMDNFDSTDSPNSLNPDTAMVLEDKKLTKIANIHSSDSPNSPNPGTVIALQDVREQFQDITEPLQDVREPLQDVREQNAKTIAVAESCNPSYSLQINLEKYTDSKEEVCVVSKKLLDEEPECEQRSGFYFKNFENETNQDANLGSPTTLLNNTEISGVVDITSNEGLGSAASISNTEISQVANKTSDEGQDFAPTGYKNDEPNQDVINESRTTLLGEAEPLQVANKNSSEGKGFAPPILKTSQKQKWVCPGTDEEKNEFLIFKGELLVAAHKRGKVEARSFAISWANNNLEAADMLWEDWQKEKVRSQDASQNTVREAMPEFRRMPEQEHAEVLEKFVNHTKQEFLDLCRWHEHWLEFASRQFRVGQQLIPGLTAEIIQKIRAH